MIKRSEAKILFKPPWRANIFLQVIILALYISFLCLDGGRALHFLTSLLHFTVLSHPFPADSNVRVRAGWRPRATLVLCHAHPCWQLADQHTDLLPVQVLIEQSKWVLGIWKTANLSIFLISGSFFKTAAEDLGLASLQWRSIAVN